MLRHLASIIGIAVLVLVAHSAGALKPVHYALTEFRFGQVTREPTGQVVLVEIDARSLAAIGTWPWPRNVHAQVVDALRELNAGEIAVDIDFSTSSNPQADLALEQALERAGGSVILAAFNQQASADLESAEIHANLPLERFAQHAWIASVNVSLDPDGVVRGFSYGEIIDGAEFASIPAMLGGHMGQSTGAFLIDFGIRADAIDRISAVDLIEGAVAPERVAGKKVIFGASAVELRDLFQVPVHGIVSGPMVQALSTESILQGRTLTETGPLLAAMGMLLISVAVLGGRRAKLAWGLAGLAAVALSVEGAAIAVQAMRGVVLDTSPWLAALFGFAAMLLFREIGLRRILLAISSTETRNTRTILAQVVSDNFAGVVVAHEDGTIHAASRSAAATLFPGSQLELSGLNWRTCLPAPLTEALTQAIDQYRSGLWVEEPPRELAYKPPGGDDRLLEYVIRPSRLSGGVSRDNRQLADSFVASLTFVDVTETRRAQDRLAYLARFDTLTGLPNRNQFSDELAAMLERKQATGEHCAVLFFDLDRFKNVNDTLGHKYGDLLLRAVARRVRELIGPDDLAARFGGDEYAIIHVGERAAEPLVLAENLIHKISEPYQVDGHRLIIGVSIGLANLTASDADPDQVMKNADTALYRAKATGGNAVRVYEPSMDAGLKARQLLEVDLWDAFERNQFEVFYQPQVDMRNEEIIGVEALLRWRHPERGFVSPAQFIPVAEAVGLIEPLGAWVLRQACIDVAGWPKPIKVAVNVSPVQFTRGDLIAEVRSALAKSGLPPAQLDLEITESLYISENSVIEDTINHLRSMGISFSIDDFGTGYSSLSYIRKFPVQKLKIDKSFIDGLPADKELVAIVRAISALATSLDIRVNAEGIENAEQVAALRLLGCNEGQGYLFGKPMPNADLVALLERAVLEVRLSA